MNCVPKFRSFLWGNHVAGNTRTLAIGLGMNRTKSTLAKSLRSNNWTQSETFDELLYTIAGMHMPLLERIIRHRHLCGMSSTSTNGPRQLYASLPTNSDSCSTVRNYRLNCPCQRCELFCQRFSPRPVRLRHSRFRPHANDVEQKSCQLEPSCRETREYLLDLNGLCRSA